MHVILYKTYTSTTLFHDFLLAAVLLYLLFSYVIITVEDTLNITFTGNILNLSSAEVICRSQSSDTPGSGESVTYKEDLWGYMRSWAFGILGILDFYIIAVH